jgi:hypothetical protein
MCRGRPERSFVGMITKRSSLLLVAAVTLLCAALLWPAAGHAAGRTKTIRIFSKTVSLTLTHADGTVVDHPPFPEVAPGDVMDIYALDFSGNHKKHSKRFSGSEHLHCVFATGEPDCTSTVALGRSLLVFQGNRLVDGAGRFLGATGRVLSTKEVPGGTDAVAKIKLAKH